MEFGVLILAPPPVQAPHSSLVHMFETVCGRACKSADHSFFGTVAADGSWVLDYEAVLTALNSSLAARHPLLILGTAFSFVHLLDFLGERDLRFRLPHGSRVMETGGYKNRSRAMPKEELHRLITERLGIPNENIVCEYGMSELGSQAYDSVASDEWRVTSDETRRLCPSLATRHSPLVTSITLPGRECKLFRRRPGGESQMAKPDSFVYLIWRTLSPLWLFKRKIWVFGTVMDLN